MKNRAQRAQEQNRARASPSRTACLIGKLPSNLSPHKCWLASSRSPWSAKTSQMGVLYPTTPKIFNLPPPNLPNSERTTQPLFLALFTHVCWRPQPLPNHPALLYTPTLPSGILGKSTIIPAHPKLILTTPGSMAGPYFSPFFGWWATTGIDV